MASSVQSQRASGTSNHVILSLCLITTCLLNITTLPLAMEQGGHILLWVNLAVGYLLAMASLFLTDAETKAAVVKLSVFSAWISMIIVVMLGELSAQLNMFLMFRHVAGFSWRLRSSDALA